MERSKAVGAYVFVVFSILLWLGGFIVYGVQVAQNGGGAGWGDTQLQPDRPAPGR